jgi:pimeloyl-ACP methyl ester carboxylesterase
MKVYFLSGICVNCNVFDQIQLPEGYEKVYIEWILPEAETFEEYARKMAETIDIREPFVLIGYSMGGTIAQEMNTFLKPEKTIIISSIKATEEIPHLFRIVKKTRMNGRLPQRMYKVNKKISDLFVHWVFDMSDQEIADYVAYTSPHYMKWTTCQITEWEPKGNCANLYHIHGTKDQVFPFSLIQNAIPVEGGDHVMIIRKTEEVNRIINQILCKNITFLRNE